MNQTAYQASARVFTAVDEMLDTLINRTGLVGRLPMTTRVTTQTMMNSSLRNLQSATSELARLQEQGGSRKAITRPSDDPSGTADALAVRAEIKSNNQYERNINDGNGWLTTANSALSSVTDLMNRAKDLTVQGANDGALSPTATEAIAVELESIRDELLAQANTTYLGRSIFAGTSDEPQAFAGAPDYAYSGGQGSVNRRISDGSTVRVDVDGARVFGAGPAAGTASMFTELDAIVKDLRNGVSVGPHLTTLDTRLDTVLTAFTTVGARHSTVLGAEASNLDRKVDLEAMRSGIEDVDIEKIILELKMQEVTYQTALSVTARTLQTTLMDFIR